MKKKMFVFFLSVCCLYMSGQAQKTRAGFSVSGGLATMRGTVDGLKEGGKYTPGFGIGILIDAPIKKSKFSFQPVLQYIQKGKLQTEPIGTFQDKVSYELRYTELVLNFLYNSNGSNGGFFIGAGPAVSFGMPSRILTKTDDGTKTETTLTFGNEIANDFRGVDYGVNFVLGYRLKGGFFVSANSTLGLRNLIPANSLSTGDIKNTNFGINLGWLFNNK
jgi:Outer membrane protein beta-barrel domain